MKNITIKKQIILPILLFLMIGTIYAFSNVNEDIVVREEMGFTFGQRDLNCKGGTGLCIPPIPTNLLKGAEFDAIGEIGIDRDGNTFIRIKKNSITVSKAEEQFGGEYFEVSEDANLEVMSTNQQFKSRGGKQILKKGKFPVKEDKNFYLISF